MDLKVITVNDENEVILVHILETEIEDISDDFKDMINEEVSNQIGGRSFLLSEEEFIKYNDLRSKMVDEYIERIIFNDITRDMVLVNMKDFTTFEVFKEDRGFINE